MGNDTTKRGGEFKSRVDTMGKRLHQVLSVLRSGEISTQRFLCIFGHVVLILKGEVLARDRLRSHNVGPDSAEAMQMGTMIQE